MPQPCNTSLLRSDLPGGAPLRRGNQWRASARAGRRERGERYKCKVGVTGDKKGRVSPSTGEESV